MKKKKIQFFYYIRHGLVGEAGSSEVLPPFDLLQMFTVDGFPNLHCLVLCPSNYFPVRQSSFVNIFFLTSSLQVVFLLCHFSFILHFLKIQHKVKIKLPPYIKGICILRCLQKNIGNKYEEMISVFILAVITK